MSDPRWKAVRAIVVGGKAIEAGQVFTAAPEKVAEAVARRVGQAGAGERQAEVVSASVIVATMWDHVEVVGAVDPAAPPTQADLDSIAERMTAKNCGVRPAVRVLEDARLPAYEETGEATCEELHEDGRWRYVRRWAE